MTPEDRQSLDKQIERCNKLMSILEPRSVPFKEIIHPFEKLRHIRWWLYRIESGTHGVPQVEGVGLRAAYNRMYCIDAEGREHEKPLSSHLIECVEKWNMSDRQIHCGNGVTEATGEIVEYQEDRPSPFFPYWGTKSIGEYDLEWLDQEADKRMNMEWPQ